MYDRVTLLDLAADPVSWLLTMNAAGTNCAFKSGETLGGPTPWWTALTLRPGCAASSSCAGFLIVGDRHRPRPRAWRSGSSPSSCSRSWGRGPPGCPDRPARSTPRVDGMLRCPGVETRPGGEDSELVYLHRVGDAEPEMVVSSSGELWRRDGQRLTLADHHRSGAPVMGLLLKAVPDLLPSSVPERVRSCGRGRAPRYLRRTRCGGDDCG